MFCKQITGSLDISIDESLKSAYLQSTAHFNGIDILHNDHAEVISLHQVAQNRSEFLVLAPDGGFAEFLFGYFIGQIGSHEHRARDLQVSGDDVWDQFNAAAFGNVKAFDERQSDRRRLDFAQQLLALRRNELMWHDEDENVGVLSSIH